MITQIHNGASQLLGELVTSRLTGVPLPDDEVHRALAARTAGVPDVEVARGLEQSLLQVDMGLADRARTVAWNLETAASAAEPLLQRHYRAMARLGMLPVGDALGAWHPTSLGSAHLEWAVSLLRR